MERTGLIRDVIDSVERIYHGREWLDTDGLEAKGRLAYRRGIS